MVTVLRPLSTSELLDRTFHLYRNHFWVFVGISVVPQLAVLALQLAFRFRPDPREIVAMMIGSFFIWLGAIIAAEIAHAGTVVAVSELHLDRNIGIRSAYSTARSSLLRVVWISLVVIIVPILFAMLFAIPLGIVIGIVSAVAGASFGNVMAIRLGSVLLVVLVPLVAMRWWLIWSLVVPVTVLEGTGLRASMRRSKYLTKGRRWRILGVYILIGILVAVVSWIIQAPLFLFTGLQVFRDPSKLSVTTQALSLVGGFVSTSLVGGLATIALTLIYYDQRVRKEGFDLQLMMSTMQQGAPAAAAAASPNS